MKKTFQMIGLISLTCFSFFVTEKTATVVNDMDEIMIEIKEKKDDYKIDAIDAIIENNTIIPGINAKEVNINKSYKNMKSNGYFSDKLFIYDYENPKISLTDNIDKYIIKGNPSKRMVSLIFTIESDEDITDLLTIINNYNVKANFFVNYTWFTNNNEIVSEMIKKGHIISPLMENYSDSNFEWMNMALKKINKQNVVFCYNINDNQSNLDECVLKKNYTIKPIIVSENTPLVDIKEKLESGSIFSLKANSQVKKELSTILIYIKSKGYKITNLEEHILE
ncbi:MAG: polysaccharide deacetylase family protein [Bacilli bacterium]|nr:polysaccharide deacetylase family protein [Bacilli bacterium]